MRDPLESIYQAELSEAVSAILAELEVANPRAADVARLHMLQEKTQRETGAELLLSRDQVAKAKPGAATFLAEELKNFQDYY